MEVVYPARVRLVPCLWRDVGMLDGMVCMISRLGPPLVRECESLSLLTRHSGIQEPGCFLFRSLPCLSHHRILTLRPESRTGTDIGCRLFLIAYINIYYSFNQELKKTFVKRFRVERFVNCYPIISQISR